LSSAHVSRKAAAAGDSRVTGIKRRAAGSQRVGLRRAAIVTKRAERSVFADDDRGQRLDIPFGMAFAGGSFFVGNQDEVRRFASGCQSRLQGAKRPSTASLERDAGPSMRATLGSSSLGGCPASCPDTYDGHDHGTCELGKAEIGF
jgi:hypothetical protein